MQHSRANPSPRSHPRDSEAQRPMPAERVGGGIHDPPPLPGRSEARSAERVRIARLKEIEPHDDRHRDTGPVGAVITDRARAIALRRPLRGLPCRRPPHSPSNRPPRRLRIPPIGPAQQKVRRSRHRTMKSFAFTSPGRPAEANLEPVGNTLRAPRGAVSGPGARLRHHDSGVAIEQGLRRQARDPARRAR